MNGMTGTRFRDLDLWRQITLVVCTVLAAGTAGAGLAFTVTLGDIRPALSAIMAVALLIIVGLHVAAPARDDEDEEVRL